MSGMATMRVVQRGGTVLQGGGVSGVTETMRVRSFDHERLAASNEGAHELALVKDTDQATPTLIRALLQQDGFDEVDLMLYEETSSQPSQYELTHKLSMFDVQVVAFGTELLDMHYQENMARPLRDLVTLRFARHGWLHVPTRRGVTVP